MYAALFTAELDDEPMSLYSDHLYGGHGSAAIAVTLLGHIKGCQIICCSFAGYEQIGTGTLKVKVEPIEGVVVLASPGPAQTLPAFADRHAAAQVTLLRFITLSLARIWVLLCLNENTVILVT